MKVITVMKRVPFYLAVGLGYLSLWLLGVLVNYPEQFIIRSINYIWNISFLVLLNTIFFEYTLSQATRKRIVKFIFLLIAHAILYSFGLFFWRNLGLGLGFYTELRVFPTYTDGVVFHLPLSLASLLFFGVFKHIYDYRKLIAISRQLRYEKQNAELNYLKSQTNPHFLFNTLNNIYSLAKDKSDLAPESILRLSKILRFMLYETSVDFISIERELNTIKDYCALEELRYDASLNIKLNFEIEDTEELIPPLLLIPLVENAFKHGAAETSNQPFVDIYISVKRKQLVCIIKNSIEGSHELQSEKKSIGLPNLKRQLELLYTDFKLTSRINGSEFLTTLEINLGSHVQN